MTMKERPILFSSPMIRALLAGAKTQTRRILKPEKVFHKLKPYTDSHFDERGNFRYRSGENSTGMIGLSDPNIAKQWCEYCSCDGEYANPPGNLWVRETHLPKTSGTIYRADFSESEAAGLGGMYGGWKPSIFCKRKDSRITLEIVGVRVERLQDISESDALAEGITHHTMNDSRVEYQWLWESINGAVSWESNPWVWVIEFKRIKP